MHFLFYDLKTVELLYHFNVTPNIIDSTQNKTAIFIVVRIKIIF